MSNLSAQSRKLYHPGVGEVSRSSLARVNAEKPWELHRDLFGALLGRYRSMSPGHGFRFKNPLYSLDSTVVDLCLSMFPWAKFRRTKGGLKARVALSGVPRRRGRPTALGPETLFHTRPKGFGSSWTGPIPTPRIQAEAVSASRQQPNHAPAGALTGDLGPSAQAQSPRASV